MTAPLLLDLTHTSHTRARTGIQRVARALHASLGADAVSICHDPYAHQWRELAPWELENITATSGAAKKRGAQWPLSAKLRGRWQRWSQRLATSSPEARSTAQLSPTLPRAPWALLMPEIFSPAVAANLPGLFSITTGPRVALFHDAIALKFPELSPGKTVARFPNYLRELLRFDGVAANSEDSRQTLIDYWAWLGVSDCPPVAAIPLGIDRFEAHASSENAPRNGRLTVLCVGSIEGRKNHLALLDACEGIWASGVVFDLRLIGLAHAQTGRAALERIASLQAAGRPVHYDGPVDDLKLEQAYAECAFTVYPSLIEGFGLPVLESVARGRPCICSSRGALGEAARGGGCLTSPVMDAASLAASMGWLLSSEAVRAELIASARARRFKSWTGYTSELLGWMKTLPRRSDPIAGR